MVGREGREKGAAAYLPPHPTLANARAAVQRCRGCALWKSGTQAVFGEGAPLAALMLVGEQPGDAEDRAGRPFVGPAGQLLDRALVAAGIDRRTAYVTNAVKHFKWERGEKGRRRIHKKPTDAEVRACYPWLETEIALVRPRLIVALGATAAQALLGKSVRVMRDRGRPIASPLADVVVVTVHPSSILRSPDAAARVEAEALFVADLERARELLSA